ncbi:MAG: helix-hairpin-helix domain-containing protein [Balneolaceae bacterium]
MGRQLFFLLEKLQITRRERMVIGGLAGFLMIFGGLTMMMEKKALYDQDYYGELESVFRERSRKAAAERGEIMARYRLHRHGEERENLGAEAAEAGTGSPGDRSGALSADPTGERVSVNGDTRVAVSFRDTAGEERSEQRRVDLNRAGPDELETLPGIGPVYAARIIEWRKRAGPFIYADQLLEIRGIGAKRLEILRPLVQTAERVDSPD